MPARDTAEQLCAKSQGHATRESIPKRWLSGLTMTRSAGPSLQIDIDPERNHLLHDDDRELHL